PAASKGVVNPAYKVILHPSGVRVIVLPFPTRRSSDLRRSRRPSASRRGCAFRPVITLVSADSSLQEVRRNVCLCELNAHPRREVDRKSTRLNSSHSQISYAVFCLKKKKTNDHREKPGT